METINIRLCVRAAVRLSGRVIRLIYVVVELDESVEFKSLPSGLHDVEEDIMYDAPSLTSDIMDLSAYE